MYDVLDGCVDGWLSGWWADGREGGGGGGLLRHCALHRGLVVQARLLPA